MPFSWLCLLALCATLIECQGKTIKKAEANLIKPLEKLSSFQGKSYPYGAAKSEQKNVISKTTDSWQGKWFPYAPGEPHIPQPDEDQVAKQEIAKLKQSWNGKWFPQAPGEPHSTKERVGEMKEATEAAGQSAQHMANCDDGVHKLSVDYDAEDKRLNYNYLCITSNRSLFEPNLNTESLLTTHFLPSAYVPPAKCLNESIGYSHEPATNGAFRPLPAVYGSYKYLPAQRYLRNLAEGAILMLYHPCANQGQVEQLQRIVRGCLYRHLITPSPFLTPERPLALLAWSTSLSMSVVDNKQAAHFIRKYAKLGPLSMPNLSRVVEKRDAYKAALLTEAHLVTDLDDSELCGYMEEHM